MSIFQKDTTLTKIFVGGLPYHTTDDTLRQFFDKFGEIEEAVVITDRQTGKSRGYGFVTMADRLSAERACKDPNPIIDGRKANVNLAYLGAKPRTLAHDILAAFPLGVKAVPISNGYASQLARLQPYCQTPAYLTTPGTALALPNTALPLTHGPIQQTTTSPTTPAVPTNGLSLDCSSATLGYQSYPVIYGIDPVPTAANGQVIGFITPNGTIVPVTMTGGATTGLYPGGPGGPGGLTPLSPSIFPATAAPCYQTQAIGLHDHIQ